MYLGALCSGILESLADVEKAALAALRAPHHRGRAWPAIQRALHIRSKKVDDPEDPSSPCSPAKKQALQQTWMEMLSATSAAFQNGEDYPAMPSSVILLGKDHHCPSLMSVYQVKTQDRPHSMLATYLWVFACDMDMIWVYME